MRRITAPLLLLLGLLAGCQHLQLEHHTLRQAGTLTDLQYKQVLGNLALMHAHPCALPYYSLAGTGQTNVQINASANTTGNVDLLESGLHPFLWYFDKSATTVTGGETNLDQWTTASVLNPDELGMMRAVYQKTLGCETDEWGPKVDQWFAQNPSYLQAMRPGWVCFGGKHQVPHDASFVGHYGDGYAWVMADGVNDLTHLTLAILDLGTAISGGGQGVPAPGHIGDIAKQKAVNENAKTFYDSYDAYVHAPADKKEAAKAAMIAAAHKVLIAVSPTGTLPRGGANAEYILKPTDEESITRLESEVQKQLEAERLNAQQQYGAAPYLKPRQNLYNPYSAPTTNFSPP